MGTMTRCPAWRMRAPARLRRRCRSTGTINQNGIGMRIGITYDLKAEGPSPQGAPDDFQEEFDSPVTVEAIAAVLRGLGHEVVKLGDGREMLQRLLADQPD